MACWKTQQGISQKSCHEHLDEEATHALTWDVQCPVSTLGTQELATRRLLIVLPGIYNAVLVLSWFTVDRSSDVIGVVDAVRTFVAMECLGRHQLRWLMVAVKTCVVLRHHLRWLTVPDYVPAFVIMHMFRRTGCISSFVNVMAADVCVMGSLVLGIMQRCD